MICSACGTSNRPESRFCRNCGTTLSAGCPTCGAANDPEDKFCGTCGTALRGAGERASGLGSNEQPVRYFEQSLAVTTDPSDEADIRLRAGEAASLAGEYSHALEHVERAVELRRTAGDATLVAAALTALGRAHLAAFAPSRAVADLEAAVAELAAIANEPAGITLRGQLARAYMLIPDPQRALPLCDEVLAAAERADMVAVVADTLITRGTALNIAFRFYEGMGALRAGTQLAEESGLTSTALRGRSNELQMLYELEPRDVPDVARAALAQARRLGQRPLMSQVVQSIGMAGYLTGDWASSLEPLDELLAEDPDDPDWLSVVQPWMFIRASRGEAITIELARLLGLLETSEEHLLQTLVHDTQARIWFIEGRLAEAREEALASNAMETYPDILHIAIRSSLWLRDLPGAQADVRALDETGAHGPALNAQKGVYKAGLAALAGDPSAVGLYREGRRALRDRGLRFVLALSAIDMATLMPDEPDTTEAVAEAREILGELGARPFLERLDALVSAAPTAATASITQA